MMAVDRMHWLDVRAHAPLLVHAVCGDRLSPPDHGGAWFAPAGVSRGDRVMLFSYETDQATIGLCAVLPTDISADWITRLRGALSPQGAEAKWAHFVGQLGPYQSVTAAAAPIWLESDVQCDGKTWRARRARHPSTLLNLLLTRERAEAEAQIQAAFGVQSKRPADLDVGEVPRKARRANMGDNRSE